jgi:hypothetical protein
MKSARMCVLVAVSAALLAGCLSMAFGLCSTGQGKIEPTGTNVGAVQFDAIIELNRYSSRPSRHNYMILFVRYWVARDYYSAAVVWAEPQSTDFDFALYPQSLSITGDRQNFNIAHEFYPKYCNVAPPDRKIDGKSIVSVIESAHAPTPHDVIHWETRDHWAVRQGDWKLVHNGPATDYKGRNIPKVETFLSNMSQDVTETKNIAGNHPDIVKKLTKLHDAWAENVKQT